MSDLTYSKVPGNSISCYIGRICETPGDDFCTNGILWVDLYDLTGTSNKPPHGESGTTQYKAYASWTLRSAYIAWNRPPKIKYKGRITGKGKLDLKSAMLSNITIAGGAPLNGITTIPVPPLVGQTVSPVAIAGATGTADISVMTPNCNIDVSTEELEIELTSQNSAQTPWCLTSDSVEGDEVYEDEDFIKAGDKALCMAFGNSLNNLYVVDIFR